MPGNHTEGRRIAVGASWMIAGRAADRVVGLVSMAILARLLVPDDFGLLALAAGMVAIVEALGSFSFDWALVREERLNRAKLNTAWTLRIIADAMLAIAVVAVGRWASVFYDEPRLGPVTLVLAGALLISAAENIGTIYFRRDMTFDKEFLLRFCGKLAGFAATVPLAFVLRNYWALLGGVLASKLMIVVMSYVMHPYRPGFDLSRSRDLLGFSVWMQINSILDLVRTRLPDFVIGRVTGMHAVGYYSVANEIANLPSTELIAPINRAVFPGYAKQAVERGPLAQTFLNVIGIVWTVALPASAGVAVTAPLIVATLLGQKWFDATPILQVLAIAGAGYVLYTNVTYVFLAVGRPRLTTLMNIVAVGLFVPGLLLLVPRLGPIGSAYAYLTTALVMLPVSYAAVSWLLKLNLWRLLSVTWRPAVASLVMYATVASLGMPELTTGALALAPGLLLRVIAGISAYVACLGALWLASGRPAGAESAILEFVIRRLRAAPPAV